MTTPMNRQNPICRQNQITYRSPTKMRWSCRPKKTSRPEIIQIAMNCAIIRMGQPPSRIGFNVMLHREGIFLRLIKNQIGRLGYAGLVANH